MWAGVSVAQRVEPVAVRVGALVLGGDPAEHGRTLNGIRGLRLAVREVRPKFKYGGNVDDAHRAAVVEHLHERGGPGDRAAIAHLRRR